MAITGKDIIVVLSQNNVALAATRIKSQDVHSEADVVEKSSPTQQWWKEFVAGRKSWTLTLTYLVLSADRVLDLLKVGQTFQVTIKKSDDNVNKVAGTAILKAVDQKAAVGNLVQGSWTLQGSGALT